MPIPMKVARFNRLFTNRLAGPLAGRLPGLVVVRHVGRSSGRTYRTPMAVFERDGHCIIAMTYGPGCDWVRNVMAAGCCVLEQGKREVRLHNPRIVVDASNSWAPLPVGVVLYLLRATEHLLLDDSMQTVEQRRQVALTQPQERGTHLSPATHQ